MTKWCITYAVPEPVGGRRESDPAGSYRKRKDLPNDYPRTWSPRGGEEEDVNADESDFRPHGGGVGSIGRPRDRNDEFADHHSEGTPDQERATTEALDGVEGNRGGADVDEGGDEADEEGVADGAELLEKGGAEVEDEVDAGPLLHHLQGGAEDGAAQIALLVEQGAFEAIGPAAEVAALRDDLELVLMIGDDLGQLRLHELGVAGLAAQSAQHVGGPVDFPTLDEVAGGFGEEEETGAEDHGPEHLHAHGHAVGGAGGVVLRAIVHAGGEQEADGDAELIAGHDGAAHLLGRDLGHVEDDDGGDEADAEACDQTTGDEKAVAGGCGLEDDADDEDDAAEDDGGATAGEVGDVPGHDGTEEGAGGQDGNDERLLP